MKVLLRELFYFLTASGIKNEKTLHTQNLLSISFLLHKQTDKPGYVVE